MSYRTILADPPWPVRQPPKAFGAKGNAPLPYASMTVPEIAALPVQGFADDVAPTATLYTCRHACASLLIHSGVSPAEVAQIMGHSIQTLLSRYTHVYAEAQDRVSVDEAIRRARDLGDRVTA